MIKSSIRLPFVCATLALLLVLAPTNPALSQKRLTREQVLEDAKTTEDLLKKYHPNLYAHRTSKQIRKIWGSAKAQISNNPSYLDSITLAQKILATACDEHTRIIIDGAWVLENIPNYKSFPAGLVIQNDGLYFDDLVFSTKSKEIIGINNRKSSEIVDFLRSITSADGCQKSEILFLRHIDVHLTASILLTNFLGTETNSFDVKYRHAKTGAIKTSNLRPVSLGRLSDVSRYWSIYGRWLPLKSLGIESNPLDWKFANDVPRQMIVRTDEDRSLYYIYLPSFKDGKAQARYIDEEMRDLIKENPDHVILDLTDNSGGSGHSAQRLLSYFLNTSSRIWITARTRIRQNIADPNFIWRDKKERDSFPKLIRPFKSVRKKGGQYKLPVVRKTFGNKSYQGNLTVLVSPKTASAATIVATILKRKAGAKIVGDIGDASMTTSCQRAPGAHPLPYSKAAILIPPVCGDRHPDAKTKGNLLRPDVPVDISTRDSRKTNGAILNAAIKALGLKKGAGLAKAD